EAGLRKHQELAPAVGCVHQLAELDDLGQLAEPLSDGGAARGTSELLHAQDGSTAHVQEPTHPFIGKVESFANSARIDGSSDRLRHQETPVFTIVRVSTFVKTHLAIRQHWAQ